MRQTFIKTIQGHEMEFVRLLYPLRYNVILRILNANPIKLVLKKDEKDTWGIEDQQFNMPPWINEITLDINHVIEENEKDVKVY